MSEGIVYRFPPFGLADFRDEFNVPDDANQYMEYKKYLESNVHCHWYPNPGNNATMLDWFHHVLITELTK